VNNVKRRLRDEGLFRRYRQDPDDDHEGTAREPERVQRGTQQKSSRSLPQLGRAVGEHRRRGKQVLVTGDFNAAAPGWGSEEANERVESCWTGSEASIWT
jgi:hypothetical protein